MAPFSSGAEFDDTSEIVLDYSTTLEVALLLFLVASMAFIFLVGIIANVIVLVVFARRPHLRTLSNRFVINLLIANLLACCVLLPLTLLDDLIDWGGPGLLMDLPPFFCGVADGAAALVAAGSILATLLIAIDQYFAVMDPLHYHMKITKLICCALIVGSWIVAIAVGSLAGTPMINNASNFRGLCKHATRTVGNSAWFVVLFGVCVFIIPLALLTTIYIRIYTAAHRNSRRTRVKRSKEPVIKEETVVESNSGSRASSFRNTSSQLVNSLRFRISNASLFLYREEGRAARISIIVLGVALLCWLPYFCTMVLHSLEYSVPIPRIIDSLSLLLTLANSVFSPFIYAYRSQRLQREVKRLFRFSTINQIRRPLTRNRRLLPSKVPIVNDKKSVMIAQKQTDIILNNSDKMDTFEDDYYPLSSLQSTIIDKSKKNLLLVVYSSDRWNKWRGLTNKSPPPVRNIILPEHPTSEHSRSSFSSATTQGTSSTTDTEV